MGCQLKSGPGWRVGWDPTASDFQGLIGADTWAIELTGAEFTDFCQLLEQLVAAMNQMQGELMDQETLTCEVVSDLVWMEVRGYPQAYGLGFILLTGRRGEGQWPAIAVPELVQATQLLKVF